MWTRFVQWLKKFLADKESAPTPTPDPAPVPSEEYIYTPGAYVERVVDIAGGSWEAEIYVPEAGRINDFGGAEIFSLRDGPYHGKVGNVFACLLYKIKSCAGAVCSEPRYNLSWSTWRKVKCVWTPRLFTVTIDGHQVSVKAINSWGPVVTAMYGCREHCPTGAKARNIKWE